MTAVREILRDVKEGYRYAVAEDLFVLDCSECHIVFAIPNLLDDRARAHGDVWWYCPNGHQQHYGTTENTRLKQQVAREKQRAEQAEQAARFQRERAESLRQSVRAYRGHLTRIRNRIASGVCPVPGCKRSGFANVRAHIRAKHPDWTDEQRLIDEVEHGHGH